MASTPCLLGHRCRPQEVTTALDVSQEEYCEQARRAAQGLDTQGALGRRKQTFAEVVIDASLEARGPSAASHGTIKEGFMALKAECIEAVAGNRQILVSDRGGFVMAVYHAFNSHIPLCFGPDDLWTLIIQGVSKHIELNAEELRGKFVDFEGKKVLRIRGDQFSLGSPDNDWAGCFEEWSHMVAGNIGAENTACLVPKFSTTGSLEKALHELALMDCMKSYFEFRCRTDCGISKVKLLGTGEDWKLLAEKVEGLRQYDLGWWVDELLPILEKIRKTYAGEEVDKIFWYTIYKQWSTRGSGASTYVNGWITSFFPYVNKCRRRDFCNLEELRKDASGESDAVSRTFVGRGRAPGTLDYMDVPNGVSATPFIWEYHGAEIPMTIYGGFAGCEMDGEYIRPVLAWAVGKSREGVYEKLVRTCGAVPTWTAEAVCQYLAETNSSVGRESLPWFRENGVTGKLLLDHQEWGKLAQEATPPFDERQFSSERAKLHRLAGGR